MSTPATATIAVKNTMTGLTSPYLVRLYHYNEDYGVESHSWSVLPGLTSGFDFTVHFNIGSGAVSGDRWWALLFPLSVSGGSFYYTTGDPTAPEANVGGWKECQLRSEDSGKQLTFEINTQKLQLNLKSGGCSTGMNSSGGSITKNYNSFTNIFVLMLENHSFDNIFGLSGISGIVHATTSDSNSSGGVSYSVKSPAPDAMTTDPGHEFPDVVEQLGGAGSSYANDVYPPIDNSGFASNYATSTTEKTGVPSAGNIGDIMACFDTSSQLPITYELATQFVVCDNWFSSMPGPTWPNRYFVHGASSAGMDRSPTTAEATVDGFDYPNGSIFDLIDDHFDDYGWRLYIDDAGAYTGSFAQVTSISGIHTWDVNDLADFASDLKYPYPYLYTFIEPNYGDVTDDTFKGGSSQHPMDSVAGGETLIKTVYEAIRNSPLWQNSLLIITYDEHGGFYDSVAPPAAVAPGDNPPSGKNEFGFNFERYGVRVPAVLVSPYFQRGVVDHTLYDHASVPKTLETWLSLPNLTNRDQSANSFPSQPFGSQIFTTLRTDCPTTLGDGTTLLQPLTANPEPNMEARTAKDAEPFPLSGNQRGFLNIAIKADYELSAGKPVEQAAILARVAALRTRGEVRAYMSEVRTKVKAAKALAKLAKMQNNKP